MLPTSDEILRIDPHVAPYADALVVACAQYDIITPTRYAMFLAECAEESQGFRFSSEIWGPTPAQRGYDARRDLGNTKPEAIALARAANDFPGHFYAGHGLIEITGYDNHLAYSIAQYGDDRCARNPKLLAQQPDAATSAAWFWKAHGLNELADAGDEGAFEAVTKRINGGENGLTSRLEWWTKVKEALEIAP